MAIAYDSSAQGNANPGTSITFAHDIVTVSNSILLVYIQQSSSPDVITGATYDGTAMTRMTQLDTGQFYAVYGLLSASLSTASKNIVVSRSTSGFIVAFSSSYTGVDQTLTEDASTTADATSQNVQVDITTVADNCWLFAGCFTSQGWSGSGIASGSQRQDIGTQRSIFDSNAAQTPAGSHNLTFQQTASGNVECIMLSIAPFVPPAGPTNVKTVDGIVKASIKTVDGIAIGSIKSISSIT